MKWNILHESRGRIRLHLNKPRLSMAEADQLQAYLADLPGVRAGRSSPPRLCWTGITGR